MKSTCLHSKELDFTGLNITTATNNGDDDDRRELQMLLLVN